jgi:hypothetical protein
MNARNGSKVNFFGFNFSDQVVYRDVTDIGWNSFGVGSNVVLIPGNYPAQIKANIAYSKYLITMLEAGQQPRESSINGLTSDWNSFTISGKINWNMALKPWVLIPTLIISTP